MTDGSRPRHVDRNPTLEAVAKAVTILAIASLVGGSVILVAVGL